MSECAWCRGPLPPASVTGRQRRRDSIYCTKPCKQAGHRFGRAVASRGATDRPLRIAYADPPYPGLARRYYACDEVDHVELVERLVRDYPDGWALSTSADALRSLLPLCPPDVRTAVWVRGPRRGHARRARNAWEAVLYRGGRLYEAAPAALCDVFTGAPSARARSMPGALVGMKSAAFASWLFDLLGLRAGDELADLFPGSGAIGRAWARATGLTTSTATGRVQREATGRVDQVNPSPPAPRDQSATGLQQRPIDVPARRPRPARPPRVRRGVPFRPPDVDGGRRRPAAFYKGSIFTPPSSVPRVLASPPGLGLRGSLASRRSLA